ncbi:MAG: hypothetical protein AAF585_18515, partial [Verrucomicrobiota bacterium]
MKSEFHSRRNESTRKPSSGHPNAFHQERFPSSGVALLDQPKPAPESALQRMVRASPSVLQLQAAQHRITSSAGGNGAVVQKNELEASAHAEVSEPEAAPSKSGASLLSFAKQIQENRSQLLEHKGGGAHISESEISEVLGHLHELASTSEAGEADEVLRLHRWSMSDWSSQLLLAGGFSASGPTRAS